MPYLGLLADDGHGGLKLIARYDGSMPGWQFKPGDQFFVGDFDGDGKADVFVFNGNNWSIPYLGMLRSSGTGLSLVQRYDANLPSWQMRPTDQFFVGDFNGDKKADRSSSTGRRGPFLTWECWPRMEIRFPWHSVMTATCQIGKCDRPISISSEISTETGRPTCTFSTGMPGPSPRMASHCRW